jgi:hypothetical protein
MSVSSVVFWMVTDISEEHAASFFRIQVNLPFYCPLFSLTQAEFHFPYKTCIHHLPCNMSIHITKPVSQPTNFNPEDGGSMFFRNILIRPVDYTVSQSRGPHSHIEFLPPPPCSVPAIPKYGHFSHIRPHATLMINKNLFQSWDEFSSHLLQID